MADSGEALVASLSGFVVVLVEPRMAVNVGNVVRALKNMAITHVRLVRPATMNLDDIQISAHRTEDIVAQLQIFDDLDAALADCHLVCGTTARSRRAEWVVSTPREQAAALVGHVQEGKRIALVFGRERTGLTNAELDRCDAFLTIPTRPDYSSLNLAQAVLVVCYEMMMAAQEEGERQAPAVTLEPSAEAGVRRRLQAQIEHTLSAIRFFKSDTREAVMRSVGRILARAQPDARETRLLLGIFTEVLKFAQLVERGIIPTQDLPQPNVELDSDSSV